MASLFLSCFVPAPGALYGINKACSAGGKDCISNSVNLIGSPAFLITCPFSTTSLL